MSKKQKYTPNGDPVSSKALEFIRSQSNEAQKTAGVIADWRNIDGALLLGAIYGATSQRAAILFGTSRDQFMYSVTLYVEGERATRYFHPERELDVLEDYLRSIYEMAENTL